MTKESIHGFVFRGLLADTSLDATQRIKKRQVSNESYQYIIDKLCINELEIEIIAQAQKMAVVYTGISAFENTLRKFLTDVLYDAHGDNWWDTKVSTGIKDRAKRRREEEAKVKWHANRGMQSIYYTDFGDLFLIIKNNWSDFEPFLLTQEWTETVLKTLERSRNVIMHSGVLENHDIERVGSNIRDWLKQVNL